MPLTAPRHWLHSHRCHPAEDWAWSSFHRWVRAGVYPERWGCGDRQARLKFDDIKDTVGE